jgi:hypothetical protein
MAATSDSSDTMKNYWKQVRALVKRDNISTSEARQRIRAGAGGTGTVVSAKGGTSRVAQGNGRMASTNGTHRREAVSKDQLVADFRKLAQKLGRTPSQRDIDQASKTGQGFSVKTYRRHFGSLSKAAQLAGLPPSTTGTASARSGGQAKPAATSSSSSVARPAAPQRTGSAASRGNTTPANQFELAFRFVKEIGGIEQARAWVDCVEAANNVGR